MVNTLRVILEQLTLMSLRFRNKSNAKNWTTNSNTDSFMLPTLATSFQFTVKLKASMLVPETSSSLSREFKVVDSSSAKSPLRL